MSDVSSASAVPYVTPLLSVSHTVASLLATPGSCTEHHECSYPYSLTPVIRFISTPSAAASEIPLLLTDRYNLLPKTKSTLGTQNFAARARAVIFGGAFKDEDVKGVQASLMDAGVGGSGGFPRVPILRADIRRATKPVGPEYAVEINRRLKECLAELRLDRDDALVQDEVVWF